MIKENTQLNFTTLEDELKMDIKELIYQSLDILEEKGNVDIQISVIGNDHDFEIKKELQGSDYEYYVLKVIE